MSWSIKSISAAKEFVFLEQVASNLAETLVSKYKRTMTVEIWTTANEFGVYVEFPFSGADAQ